MKVVNTSLLMAASLPKSPSPLSTAVFNALRLLSPRTWLGLMQVLSRSPFSEFELETCIQTTVGLLLPILILLYSTKFMESMQHSRSQLQRVLVLSPWTWQCIWQLCLQSQKFASTLGSFIQNRKKALPCAVQELETRLSNQRAYQRRRYTVYLPTEDIMQNIGNTIPPKVAIFFPGALVPSVAYSEIAGRLSDKGVIVVVPSLEPFLLAAPNLGTELVNVCGIMKKVRKELKLVEDENHRIEWSLMGHSMGAFGAMRLYDHFQKGNGSMFIQSEVQVTVNNLRCMYLAPIQIKDLVLMGVAAFVTECTDLSNYTDTANNRILLIQATGDEIVKLLGDGNDELYSNFPDATTIQADIAGGTHHGFASYNDQDGKITMQEQQRQVCERVARFLQLKS